MQDEIWRSRRGGGELTRRQVVGMLGAAGAAALTGCRFAEGQRNATARDAEPQLDCVVTPAQTEGPYFVDERLHRADIRLDPTSSAFKEGVPLRLRIHVSRVDGNACAPVEGALVDVWQCDALGVYSDVRDFNGLFDTRGQKFLRGYQISDRSGATEFLSIYPGWYSGRTVHIHFKVRLAAAARRGHEFTSQLYFDEAITDLVHAQPPYNTKGQRDTRNDRDGIFRRSGGSQLMLRLSPDAHGYVGRFAVGLRMG